MELYGTQVHHFLDSLFVSIPMGVLLCRVWKPALTLIFAAMFLSMLEPDRLGINFLSREDYRMITRGLEVTFTDILAIIIAISMLLRPGEFKIKWLPA